MAEERLFPVCVTRTVGGALKFNQHHKPLLVPGKQDPMRIEMKGPQQPGGVWHGHVYICERCGVLYVGTQGISYGKPTGPISPGGTA